MLGTMECALIAELRKGLPLVPQPYQEIAERLGVSEAVVLGVLYKLIEKGVVSRFGAILHHRELGYTANAMCVFDVPDGEAAEIGRRMAGFSFVTLCYRRKRALPRWPYNLYCMIHGRDRAVVERQQAELVAALGLEGVPQQVLFSRRRFKQGAGHYGQAMTFGKTEAAQ